MPAHWHNAGQPSILMSNAKIVLYWYLSVVAVRVTSTTTRQQKRVFIQKSKAPFDAALSLGKKSPAAVLPFVLPYQKALGSAHPT